MNFVGRESNIHKRINKIGSKSNEYLMIGCIDRKFLKDFVELWHLHQKAIFPRRTIFLWLMKLSTCNQIKLLSIVARRRIEKHRIRKFCWFYSFRSLIRNGFSPVSSDNHDQVFRSLERYITCFYFYILNRPLFFVIVVASLWRSNNCSSEHSHIHATTPLFLVLGIDVDAYLETRSLEFQIWTIITSYLNSRSQRRRSHSSA